ncbi:MAG: hypothetical protein IJP43_03485 [Oscillospiraceae bacterium]|nr:hypothetical protein [Oscillospiraceae bacterium]
MEPEIAEIRQTLIDAGCDEELCRHYLEKHLRGERQDELRLLRQRRAEIMEEIHRHSRELDCLDHLIYRFHAANYRA